MMRGEGAIRGMMREGRALRVLMVAPTSFFLDYGCHVRILEESRALLKLGASVRIVTYYQGRDWPGLEIVRSRPTPWRADYEVGSSRHKIAFDLLLSWRALQEALRWRPDIIHGHLHEGGLIGSALGHLLRRPVVFDFQGSLTAEMVDHHFIRQGSLAWYWWRRLEEKIVQLPDLIVTSTIHGAQLLHRHFGRREEVFPLPDSVNLDFFRPGVIDGEERRRRREALGIPEGRIVVVYLGLLADYQGVPQLLRAVARLRQRGWLLTLLVMGFPAVEHYRAMARSLGLQDEDIIFTGRTCYEEAPAYLALGDIAAAPKLSATEGSGKILNYMAMELPVVAYDTPASREYLGNQGVYAAPIGDDEALAEAIAYLLEHPQVRLDLGRRLRRRAERHFSWDRMGRHLQRLYARLLNRSTTSAGSPRRAR